MFFLRKGMGHEFAVITGISVLLLSSYIFYNMNAGSGFSKDISDYFQDFMKKDSLLSINEIVNINSKIALESATVVSAKHGGFNDGYDNAWICNNNVFLPDDDKARECINSTSNSYFNTLSNNFRVPFTDLLRLKLPYVDVYGDNDEFVEYRVMDGVYSTLFNDNTSYYGFVNFDDYLTANRYWYLYKGFKKSIRDIQNVLSGRMCDVLSGCSRITEDDFEESLESIGSTMVGVLESNFDGDVECSYYIDCKEISETRGGSRGACTPNRCESWINNKCYRSVKCGFGDCSESPARGGVIVLNDEVHHMASSCRTYSECGKKVICCDPCSGSCSSALLRKGAVTYTLSCVDKKYVLKYQNSAKYLEFNVKVYYGLQRGGMCVSCGCSCPVTNTQEISNPLLEVLSNYEVPDNFDVDEVINTFINVQDNDEEPARSTSTSVSSTTTPPTPPPTLEGSNLIPLG